MSGDWASVVAELVLTEIEFDPCGCVNELTYPDAQPFTFRNCPGEHERDKWAAALRDAEKRGREDACAAIEAKSAEVVGVRSAPRRDYQSGEMHDPSTRSKAVTNALRNFSVMLLRAIRSAPAPAKPEPRRQLYDLTVTNEPTIVYELPKPEPCATCGGAERVKPNGEQAHGKDLWRRITKPCPACTPDGGGE